MPVRATDPPSRAPWTYLETVDEANSVIRVRGRVDELGVDLLRGTILELSRRGHRDITVSVQHLGDVDAYAGAVLAEVAAAVEQTGGSLTVQWSPAAGTDDDDLASVSVRDRRAPGLPSSPI